MERLFQVPQLISSRCKIKRRFIINWMRAIAIFTRGYKTNFKNQN